VAVYVLDYLLSTADQKLINYVEQSRS